MLFGDQSRFAIEFVLDDNPGGAWLYGKTGYWICGWIIGLRETSTTLRDTLFLWDRISRDAGTRQHDTLMSLGTKQLARTLYCSMYGTGIGPCPEDYWDRSIEEQWARFDVGPHAESFDPWFIYTVEDRLIARLIVVDTRDTSFTEYRLEPGEFDRVLQTALVILWGYYDEAMEAGG